MNPAQVNRRIMQIAYVVEDIEKAARTWVETTGIGPFLIIRDIGLDEAFYRGKPTGLQFSGALAQAGDVQIELIQQHCDSPSVYRDYVAAGQQGFHHLAIYCTDYDRDLDFYVSRGFEVAFNGAFAGKRFAYVDTHKALGTVIELIEDSEAQRDFFQKIIEAGRDWDGVTPSYRVN